MAALSNSFMVDPLFYWNMVGLSLFQLSWLGIFLSTKLQIFKEEKMSESKYQVNNGFAAGNWM